MRVQSSIDIAAPLPVVYALAQDVARWPQLLPHYRDVRVLEEAGNQRRLRMAARRGIIPVSWKAVQRLDPISSRIEFTHVAGWTAGMEVAWIFASDAAGTRVTITHELSFRRFPLLGDWIARRIIGQFFVEAIAGRTLRCIKRIAEDTGVA
ncbi:MAG: SRPBCC family protein [Candidatus Eremiobacteraeota bacterium]|nr:SRPBCC family protein [Candidatus Eremiobacteraeota bacterium]MBC5828500.1 SRPBCC family protein [Candidatus Eremiobacteraeota bacterium]